MLNDCKFIGNFTRDPVLEKMHDGDVSVVNFRLAINRKFKSGRGERKDEVAFADFEAFDAGAEYICESFKKGDSVFVDTSLRSHKDNNGVTHYKFRVNSFTPIRIE